MCISCELVRIKIPSRILTRETVMNRKPCPTYRNRFIERFPVQVEVTVDLAISQAMDWDWPWAAEQLLSYKGWQQWREPQIALWADFDDALRPYSEIVNRVADEHRPQRLDRRDELVQQGMSWNQATDQAWDEFAKKLEVPRAARDAVENLLEKRYQEARAKLWAEIYISEGEQDSTND